MNAKRTRPFARGFTLVELMVAVTGGLFVTIAVFMLSKQATSLYQSEARVSNATLSSVVGFERLRTDIARAGFLASPNIRRDPKLCGVVNPATWPALLGRMTALSIRRSATGAPLDLVNANGVYPDEIVLAGDYVTTDQFPAAVVSDDGTEITLQTKTAAMARLGFDPNGTAQAQRAALEAVFQPGRALRLVDQTGKIQFGKIDSVLDGAKIKLVSSPAIVRRETSPYKCGIAGQGAGTMVNPVNFIRYSIGTLAGTAGYSAVYDGGPATDVGRTDLIREELDVDGAVIAGTRELVAELAVDLAFGISGVTLDPNGNPTAVQNIAPGDVPKWAGDDPALWVGNTAPQLVRQVRARLSVRSREGDRPSGINASVTDGGTPTVAAGLYRFGLTSGGAPFARVRTVQADIALRNQRDATWL